MNGSPVIRACPRSPEPTPSAPPSPRSQSLVAREPEERTKPVEKAPTVIEKAPTPPLSNPSSLAARTALPASSLPLPPTPPVPFPPKPSTPSLDPGDDDIDAALWATEYDHIDGNVIDASLRERLRNFERQRLVQFFSPRANRHPLSASKKSDSPQTNIHRYTGSSQPKGALVLWDRCALSDAHTYMSNNAHQYALLGTGQVLPVWLLAKRRCAARFPGRGGVEDEDDDGAEAQFGVFALRDLELGEEIVLRWEWSVEHVVHKLWARPLHNNPDTKRLWDILDLLRSRSLAGARKPDSSNCALSFGRMLLEDADLVSQANDLGPLVGCERYENGFELTMHAISMETRRGCKAAKVLKARRTDPPGSSFITVDPGLEPDSELEPVHVPKPGPKAYPPPLHDPTPVPRHPTSPTPPVTTPAKRAIGKPSISSSALSELSHVLNEHNDNISTNYAPEQHRGPNSIRTKHKLRIQSPTPKDEPQSLKSTEKDEATLNKPQDLQLTNMVAPVVERRAGGSGIRGFKEPQALEISSLEAKDFMNQVVDTKDYQSSEFNEVEASEPDLHRAGTETEIVTFSHRSPLPSATAALLPSSTSESMPAPPSANPDVVAHAPRAAPTPPLVPTAMPDGQAAPPLHPSPEGTASPADVVMGDLPVPSINGKDTESYSEHLNVQPRSDTPEPPSVTSAPVSWSDPRAQPALDAVDVGAVAPTANVAVMGRIRASPASFADGASYQSSASHTPLNPLSLLHVLRRNSSPGVLPALTKRLSSLGVEPLKSSNEQDPTQITPLPPRAPRSFGETPEEGEITPGVRAQPALYTPGHGSPATTPNPLPSALPPSGPRDRPPPTQPRRFSADPPSNTSPSGSSGSRPPSAPYARPPPAAESAYYPVRLRLARELIDAGIADPCLQRGPESGNAVGIVNESGIGIGTCEATEERSAAHHHGAWLEIGAGAVEVVDP
ncbi:hypothetical protein RhiJN_12465 [Ceratobasidium sp. AG-Ba]|nr:hypothetical protein RhiJN_12465 [Ceratobasidium sp. AG-Ba]